MAMVRSDGLHLCQPIARLNPVAIADVADIEIDHYIVRRIGELLPFCISLPFYFNPHFIYVFCSPISIDMKSFTAAITLASILPAIMSLTINTPYVVSTSPNGLLIADFYV
jgi:hypothetical protein